MSERDYVSLATYISVVSLIQFVIRLGALGTHDIKLLHVVEVVPDISLNCTLNSEPLSYPMYWGRGYRVNHVLLNASMTVLAFLSCIAVTLNQFVTGSIIVRAQSVCVV